MVKWIARVLGQSIFCDCGEEKGEVGISHYPFSYACLYLKLEGVTNSMSNNSPDHVFFKAYLSQLTVDDAKRTTEKIINDLNVVLEKIQLTDLQRNYFRSLINLGSTEFYLVPGVNPAVPSFGLVSKNLKAIMIIALVTPHQKLAAFFDSPIILDLRHIHSFKKGEGKRLMVAYKELREELNIPGALFTDNQRNVDYFSRYDFENIGNLGVNNEYLMKLPV